MAKEIRTEMNSDADYKGLIEFLKRDYFSRAFYAGDGQENDDLVGQVNKRFTIKDTHTQINRGTWIKQYSVSDGEKEWEFIVGTAALLFANSMQKYREKFLEENNIQGIITLKNAFFEETTIPAAVIVLGKIPAEMIWLTSAASSDDVISIFKDVRSYHRNVYFTKELDPKNFMPEFYNGEKEQLNKKLDQYETKTLKEIADIILGKSVSRHELSEEGIPYLRQRDIRQGAIINPTTCVVESAVDKYAKQLLQEGDLILTKNFGQHKLARVSADNLPAIASNSLFIIRAFGVPEDYLYQYFTSETGKEILEKQLSSIERGTVVVSITLADLRELRVPIFDEETMLELSKADELKAEDILPVMEQMSRLAVYAGKLNNQHLEQIMEAKVYSDFLKAGWAENEVQKEKRSYSLALKTVKWRPDIVLLNGDEWIGVVEVKTDFSHTPPGWGCMMNEIIREAKVPFLILSTGFYYEVHSTRNQIVKKLKDAPTKEFLLSILNGKEGN